MSNISVHSAPAKDVQLKQFLKQWDISEEKRIK